MFYKSFYMRAEKFSRGEKIGESWTVRRIGLFSNPVHMIRTWLNEKREAEGVDLFLIEVKRID